MRKLTLSAGVVTIALLTLFLTKLDQSGSGLSHPIPTDGKTIVHHGEEGEQQDRREAWFELMHRAAPGDDWRFLEYRNRLNRHHLRTGNLDFRSEECETEVLAGGQIKGRWKERGSVNQAGSVFDTEYDPVADVIWLISAGGTLFNSDRLGLSWQVVHQDLQFNPGLLKFIPYQNGRRLLAFAGRLPHYSNDDGLSWTPASGIEHTDSWGNFRDPVVLDDLQNNFFVFAKPSYWEPVSLYRSFNKGQSFSSLHTFGAHEFDRQALCSPHHSNEIFLLEKDENSLGKISRINLQNDQFEWINEGLELDYGDAPANLIGWSSDTSLLFYTYIRKEAQLEVYASLDTCQSWQFRGVLPSRPWSVGMYVLPSDPEVLFYGEVECYRSLDGGQSWALVNHWWEYYDDVAGKLHADIMHFGEFETAEGIPFLLVSNHGGLTLSEDLLFNQSNIGMHNLNVSQYYSVRTDAENPNFVYAGSQDQGFQLAESFEDESSGPELFEQVISGDYGHIVFSNERQSLWTVYPGGWVTYYQDAQSGVLTASYEITSEEESVWLPPLMASPMPQENAIYMAGGNIDGGPGSHIVRLEAEGQQISASQFDLNFKEESGGGEVSAMAVAPGNPKRWYAATTNGRLFYSADNGESWEQSLNFVPGGHYLYGQALYVSIYDEETVYLAGSGYSNPAVYRSTDGGENFYGIAEGLPSTLVLDLAANGDESLLFAATESGPYVFVVAEETWYDLSGLCAPAQTYWSVEYLPSLNTARFGTYGRGIWDFVIDEEVDVTQPPASSPAVSIYPNPSRGLLELQTEGIPYGKMKVRIMDTQGRLLFYKEMNVSGSHTLDLQQLSKGLYLIELTAGNQRFAEKVLLE